jgi:hypothetical protein
LKTPSKKLITWIFYFYFSRRHFWYLEFILKKAVLIQLFLLWF